MLDNKKIGRPTDSPKNTTVKVRLDDITLEKLNASSEILQLSKSEIIRRGIDKVYDDLQK